MTNPLPLSLTKHTYNEPYESDNELQDLQFETEQSEVGYLANALREMYMSALHLKTILQTHSAPLTEVRPPYAADVADKAAKTLSQLICSTQWHTSLHLQQDQSLMSMWTLRMKVWRRNWSQSAKILCSYHQGGGCLLYTSPSPRDYHTSRMPSSA